MREKIRQQISIVEPSIKHQHAEELKAINRLINERPQIAELVHQDLIRALADPEAGRRGKMTAEQVFKALSIKQMNGFSYEELAFHLADSKCYRAFCGLGIGDDTPSKSALQRDIKRIRAETLEQIHRIIIALAQDKGIESGRKVRVDCTVTQTNIHRPTDSSLLNDSVRVLCRIMCQAREEFGTATIDHRRRANRRALEILNEKSEEKMKKPYRDLLRITRKTVSHAERVAGFLESYQGEMKQMLLARGMAQELRHYIPLCRQVICQTERRVLLGESLRAEEKLVSIFEPHTDIIKKDRRDTYFGHKIALTGGASGLLTDLVVEKGNPADASLAQQMVSRQKAVYGRVPRQITYDGGFASKPNLQSIKAMGVKDVVFSKKCGLKISQMAKSTWVYKRLRNFRAGIEGMISYLKRCFGLRRCCWQGFESFKAYAWSSVITANLLLMARHILS